MSDAKQIQQSIKQNFMSLLSVIVSFVVKEKGEVTVTDEREGKTYFFSFLFFLF